MNNIFNIKINEELKMISELNKLMMKIVKAKKCYVLLAYNCPIRTCTV